MAKILITGNKGVVGSYLEKILVSRGHDVFGIDVRHARGDVGEYRRLERVFNTTDSFSYVYHTVAEFGYPGAWRA